MAKNTGRYQAARSTRQSAAAKKGDRGADARGIDGRGTGAAPLKEHLQVCQKAAARAAASVGRGRRTGKAPCWRTSPHAGTGSAPGRAASRDHQSQRALPRPDLWYGMPAYSKDGKVVCFFQSARKFKTRYATFGFMHQANLDEGAMWPTGFALTALTATEEARIVALVKKAVR